MQYKFRLEALRPLWQTTLTCQYDKEKRTRTFSRSTFQTTTENVPPFVIPLQSVIERDGRKFYYADIVFDEKDANAFRDFICSHPHVSVTNKQGSEQNNNLHQAHYKFIDDTTFHAQEIEFAKLVTDARIRIHESADDEQLLWELSWFAGVSPLQKSKNEVHAILLDKAMTEPSMFINPDEQTSLSALVFKASRLTSNTGNTIIYNIGGRYIMSDEPGVSYASLNEVAATLSGHPDRIKSLRAKVDAASKSEFTWSPTFESGKTAAMVNTSPLITKEDVLQAVEDTFAKLEGKTPHHTSTQFRTTRTRLQDIKIETNGKEFAGEKLDVDSIVRETAKKHGIKADLFKLS